MAASVTEYICESAVRLHPSRGPDAGREVVRGLVAAKKFRPDQLNLRQMAEGCFGKGWQARLRRVSANAEWAAESATEAVDLSAFRAVAGEVMSTQMMDPYKRAVYVADQLVGRWDSQYDDADSELTVRFPAIATDASQDVAPAMPYPRTAFTDWYVKAPRVNKHGLAAYLTLELVEANKVRQWLDAVGEVGRVVGLEEKKRKLRLPLGITNNYNRNGTSYNTYLASGDRVNSVTDLDWTNGPEEFDRLETVFREMRHPVTGERLDQTGTTVFTASVTGYALRNALGVREVRTSAGGVETMTEVEPPFTGTIVNDPMALDLLVNERGLTLAKARTWLAYGDFQRAFKWREKEPMTTFEIGPDDEAWGPPFEQDVVYACKARFRGAGFVADPFAVMEAYNNSAS